MLRTAAPYGKQESTGHHMDIIASGNDIKLHQPDLDLDMTLDCGQAFRWERLSPGVYKGFAGKRPLTIEQRDDSTFVFKDTSMDDMAFWADYFDLERDYGSIKERFSEDEVLSRACEYGHGIRILKQDREETLLSFIISQNNNIPRIKLIISRLCGMYGGFPTAYEMRDASEDILAPLKAGFRTRYLLDCIRRINSGETDLDAISLMDSESAAKELMEIKGVGAKVAACTLLFGFNRLEVCPVDVWIRRVLEKCYPNGLPPCTKGFEGIAQQYLFYYFRGRDEELTP